MLWVPGPDSFAMYPSFMMCGTGTATFCSTMRSEKCSRDPSHLEGGHVHDLCLVHNLAKGSAILPSDANNWSRSVCTDAPCIPTKKKEALHLVHRTLPTNRQTAALRTEEGHIAANQNTCPPTLITSTVPQVDRATGTELHQLAQQKQWKTKQHLAKTCVVPGPTLAALWRVRQTRASEAHSSAWSTVF